MLPFATRRGYGCHRVEYRRLGILEILQIPGDHSEIVVESAVAAIIASTVGMGLPIRLNTPARIPHRSATASSIGRIRPAKRFRKSPGVNAL